MTELDKFKRRLIRSVARLKLEQKKQSDEIWEELKNETGCDCKVLWERMRALTLKKLNRLLLADDKPDNVPAIARLTNTDWLLFDLVLVHEKIDVINVENKPAECQGEFKPPVDLFSLVQRLNIENLSGEPLAEAWAAATIYYNIEGRQCSPMLLQRRWYQLKETTRQRFYKFWFSYRGNAQLLVNAKRDSPSVLEMAIAKRYGNIITTPFVEWEELIQKKLVVLPQEFESNLRKQNLPKLCDADSPDIVLVEPSIETIDLRMDSDSDEEKDDGTQIASDPEKSNDVQVKGNEITDDKGEQTANIIKSSETVEDITPSVISQIPHENVRVKMEIPDDCEVITVPADTSNKVLDDKKLTGYGSDIDGILLPKISSVYGNLDIDVKTTPSCSFSDNNLIIKDNTDTDRDIECCDYDINRPVNENTTYFIEIDALAITNKSSSNVIDFKDTLKSNKEAGTSKDFTAGDILKQRAKEFIQTTQREMTSSKSSQAIEFSKNLTAENILKQKAEEFIRKTQKEMTKIKSNEEAESSIDLTPEDMLKQRAEEFIRKTQKEFTQTKSNEETEFSKNLTAEDILKQRAEEFIRKTEKEMTKIKSNEEAESSKDLTPDDILKQRAEELMRKTQKEFTPTKSNQETEFSKNLTAEDILKQRAEEFIRKTEKEMTKTKSNKEVEFSKDLTANDILKQKTGEYMRKIQNEITNRSKLEKNIETSVNSTRYMIETENITSNISLNNTIGNVTKKATVLDSNITNTSDYTSTNWTLVDDGIELIDDGIEIVDEDETIYKDIKIEKNDQMGEDKVEDIDTPKFDLKLLMDPVVYTTKLDLMDLNLKVMEPYTVKGEGLLNYIIKESKPISKLSIDVKEIKEDNDSPQSISSTDKKDIDDLLKTERNDDDSDSEVVISEDRKVKSSSYILQKPRSRSYNPIQLCKNPDFNTRLKRLPVGFFKSTRNLQLLKSCKPMTIDVHKAFETKLINGTLYLKSASSDTKSYEKQIDQKLERNQTATIVPSAMSVQSLIDNTIVENDLVSLLDVTSNQNISYQTEEALLSERRKVINLPDITNVRRINQKLLTAEVPPIVYQNSDETHKHTEIEASGTLTNVGNSVSEVSKDIFNSKDNTKVNYLSVSNVARFNNYNMAKNKMKRRIEVPWSTMYPILETTNERLITNDTLEKVLHVLSGNETTKHENTKKAKKKQLAAKGSDAKLKKQIDDKQKKENQNNEKRNTNKDNSQEIKELESKKKHIIVPKINIKSKSKYCCWYREKICVIEKAKTSNKKRFRLSKHSCLPENCICCCRDVTHDHIKKIETSKDTQIDAIVVSDDEEQLGLQKACESKESVNQECCVYKVIADTSLSTCQENLSNKASQFLSDENRANIVNNSNLSTRNIAQESITMVTQTVGNTVVNHSSDETMSVANVMPPLNTNENCVRIEKLFTDTSTQSTSIINETAAEFKKPAMTHVEPLTQLTTYVSDSISIEKNITNNEKPAFIQQSASNLSEGTNVENFQRRIVIDGSNHKCLVPSTVVANSGINSLDNTPKVSKDTPLFIGKNTILLTTAKLPKRNDTIFHKNSKSEILSLTPLPHGIQLILLPTGELHLVVTPGVELTAEQLQTIPDIVQEIQRQTDGLNISTILNNSQINAQNTAIDKTAIDETTSEINMNSKEKERKAIDEENIPEYNLIDKEKNSVEYQKVVQLNEDNERKTTKDIHAVHDNEIESDVNQSNDDTNPNRTNTDISETTEQKTNKLEYKLSQDNDSNVSTNRKTILSDLMEMSGISSEDTMVSQENIFFSQTIHTTEEINLPSSSDNSDTKDISKIPELSVVTSLVDLKYACDNKGDFFKLNFTTGVLAPVKVCVKKNLTKKLAPKKIDPNIVIDLTEEFEFSKERASTKRRRINLKNCKDTEIRDLFRNVSTSPPIDDSIKPLKLFKAKYPIILKRMKLGKKKINTICYDKALNDRRQKKKKNRKQNLNKIEAKIDLVDSDAPMEEEYLVDSDFGEEIESTTKICPIEANDTVYDSSDDEPLAKKSKRINEIHNLNVSNNIVDGSVSKEAIDKYLQDCELTPENKKTEDNNVRTSVVLEVPGDTMFENVEFIENEELDNAVALNFLRNESDTESCPEEDCILGV